MPKRRFLLPLLLLLTSCSGHEQDYRQYYSTMLVPSFSLPISAVHQKEMLNRYDGEDEESYFCNLYLLSNREEIQDFLQTPELSFTQKDMEYLRSMETGQEIFLCLYQVPPFYDSHLRYSIQTTDEDGNLVAMTDNFFFYPSRPSISYLFLDLVPSRRDSVGISCALYLFNKDRNESLSPENVRPILLADDYER